MSKSVLAVVVLIIATRVMMGGDVEEVAAALVREYLSRKGLKKTIDCMDEEFPRSSLSISNRSELCGVLHLEGLYKKNKSEEQPFKSMLEILTKEWMRKCEEAKRRQVTPSADQNVSQLSTDSITNDDSYDKRDQDTESHTDSLSPGGSIPSHKAELSSKKKRVDGQTSRTSRMRREVLAGPIATTSQENNKRRPARKMSACSSPLVKTDDDSAGLAFISRSSSLEATPPESQVSGLAERGSSASLKTSRRNSDNDDLYSSDRDGPPSNKSACGLGAEGLQMFLDDVDDQDLRRFSAVSQIVNSLNHLTFVKHPIDQQIATDLKEIIFGSPMSCFNVEWKCQSFTFSNVPSLRYGLVQKRGGPCGVLAAVQASVLLKLLFQGTSRDTAYKMLHVSDGVRTKCLTEAVADILWRAGDRKKATVAINSGRNQFSPMGHYRSDGVLEMVACVEVSSFEDLKQLVEEHIDQFESGPYGCVLLIVSAVLSRTIKMVKGDMDVPSSTLIGAHGYCTQELVNLLLCGRAVSNVFDDELKLDSGNGNFTLLKGIRERCNIGLLSLFEHYNICKVGSYLKNPLFPIWMVCSESHFSVLFSLSKDLTSSRWNPTEFDLYYYDGLANQQEPIRLTVYPDSAVKNSDTVGVDSDLRPPLELCIGTRWTGAGVSWNDSEPIL